MRNLTKSLSAWERLHACKHDTNCEVCGAHFAAVFPISNIWCPACPKGNLTRGVLTCDCQTRSVRLEIEQVLKERKTTHGDFRVQFKIAQDLKSTFYSHLERPLTPVQRESIDMILTKLSRICSGNSDHADHWDDIAGYAKLASKELERAEPDEVKTRKP